MYLHSVSVTKLESSVWKKTIQAKKKGPNSPDEARLHIASSRSTKEGHPIAFLTTLILDRKLSIMVYTSSKHVFTLGNRSVVLTVY